MSIFDIEENIACDRWIGELYEFYDCSRSDRLWSGSFTINFNVDWLSETVEKSWDEKRAYTIYTVDDCYNISKKTDVHTRAYYYIILLCLLSGGEDDIKTQLMSCLTEKKKRDGCQIDVNIDYNVNNTDYSKIQIRVKSECPLKIDIVLKKR